MSCLSALYFIDLKAKPIIYRDYRGEVTQNISEVFQKEVFEREESNMKPVFTIEDTHYVWLRHSNIYIIAVGKRNLNICLIYSYLYKLIEVLTAYFKELDEESIKDNFVIMYELMDETLDYGYPQMTNTEILQQFIKTESHKKVLKDKEKNEKDKEISDILTHTVSWRKPNIKHDKNEMYLDVIERVNCVISANNTTLRSEVEGVVKVKSLLSGMPNCSLGLNDRAYFEIAGKYNESMKNKTIEMDDLKFHTCVNLSKFDSDRSIDFVPPDGEFELMSYRLDVDLKPLIWVEVSIDEKSTTRIEYVIKAKTNFKSRSIASNCDIAVPVPADVNNIDFKTFSGSAVWNSGNEKIVWNIKNFQGQTEATLRCYLAFPSVRMENPNKHLKIPISLSYDIPYFTVSGIQVRYLKITENKLNYNGIPWVRYMTSNGDFHIRMI